MLVLSNDMLKKLGSYCDTRSLTYIAQSAEWVGNENTIVLFVTKEKGTCVAKFQKDQFVPYKKFD